MTKNYDKNVLEDEAEFQKQFPSSIILKHILFQRELNPLCGAIEEVKKTMMDKQKVKDTKIRLIADCDFFINNPQGMALESVLLTLKGNMQHEFENLGL